MIQVEKVIGKAINGLVHFAPNLTGKLILDLFCRPIKGKKFSPNEQAFLDRATWVELFLDGKKIQCYIWGEGSKKILLAHGFNSNAGRWRLLANLLQNAGYQIIALDVPAHGNSDWNRVNGLLYARVIEVVMRHFQPNYLVGHSFAGIAFSYYYYQLEALPVEKMVLMGIPDKLTDVTEFYFQQLGLNQKAQKAYYHNFEKTFKYSIDYFSLSNFLKNNNIPGLIIQDKNDEVTSFEGAKTVHQNWSNAQFFATQKLGHSLQGSSVYKEILRFLN